MYVILLAAVAVLLLAGLVISALTDGEGIFAKLAELGGAYVSLALGAVVILILLLLFAVKEEESGKWSTKQIVTGALSIALAFILSYIRLYKMPQGGSITPASMLPIFLFAYIYGSKKGLIVAVAFGFLQYLQDPGSVIHWAQLIIDYIFAFGALAAAGLFRKNIVPGILLGAALRLFFAVLSGVIFFAEYAPAGQSPIIYSLVYNASYMIPEAIICCVVSLVPAMRKSIEQLRFEAQK